MKLLILLLITTFSIFTFKPAKNARVFLENERGGELVAFQTTSEKGRIAFNYLKEGNYQLNIIFPQQEGKYIKAKSKHVTLTKATYNPKTKTYYYQGLEGFFAVKFSGIKKIDSEGFEVIFREKEKEGEEGLRIVLAKFKTRKSGAAINLTIKALTASQFKKATDKLGSDISTISIPTFR